MDLRKNNIGKEQLIYKKRPLKKAVSHYRKIIIYKLYNLKTRTVCFSPQPNNDKIYIPEENLPTGMLVKPF